MPEEEYEFDPWETSTGLPDKITVRIESPHFGFDAQIQNGTRCLFIPEGTIIAGTDTPEPFNQFFTVGDGWEPAGKGGSRLVREDGRAKQINNNSNYGRFFTSLKKAAEAQDLIDALRKRGTPFDAETWDGLELYLERETYTFEDRETGKDREASRLNVMRIEKMGDVKVKAKAAESDGADGDADTEKASVRSGEPETAASSNGGGPADDLDPKTKAKLRALAREHTEHKAFVEAAFDVDGVLDNAVAEEAIMAQGEGSIWASTRS